MLNHLRKEFIRRWRSPVSSLAMIAFPLLMSLMIGSISGGGGNSSSFPIIDVAIYNGDEGTLSEQLVASLGNENFTDYLRAILVETEEEGRELVANGDASALISIPAGFGEAVLDGQAAEIAVLRSPGEAIKPEIVAQGVEVLVTYLDMGGKILGEDLAELTELLEGDGFPGAEKLLALSSKLILRFAEVERYLFPPIVKIESVKESSEDDGGGFGGGINVFGYVLIMVSVMSVLFVASRSVLDFFEEEKTGMVRRQLAAPLTIAQIVRAKLVFAVIFGVFIEFLLLFIGTVLGWLTPSVHYLAALIIALAYSFAAAGLLTLIYGVSKTEKQAALLNFIVIMGMSALGGSMGQVSSFPESVQRISHFTINYWAIEAMTDQLVFGEAFRQIWRSVGILSAVGLVTMLVAQPLAQRKLRGAAR